MAKKRTITFIPRVLSPRPVSFDSATVIIGSRKDADFVLDDSAEPVHALIRQRQDAIELAAFGPLELNGALVERATLAEGDHIRIGRMSFVFVTTEQDDTAPITEETVLPNLDGALAGVDRDPAGIPSAVLQNESIETGASAQELRTEVALFWGNELLQVAHYGPGATVRVGEGQGNDFVLAAREIKEKSVVLLEPSASGPRVHVPSLAPVELDTRGQTQRSARGALIEAGRMIDDALILGEHEKVAIAFGALTMVIKRVPSTNAVARPFGDRIDQAFVSALTFTGIAAAFLFALALTTPPANDSLDDLLTRHKPSAPTVEFKDLKPKKQQGAATTGQIGRVGVKTATKKSTAPKKAHDVGVLAVLKGMTGAAATKVLGPGDLSHLDKLTNGLRGRDLGDQAGDGGLSTRGTGPGGGGDSKDIHFGGRGDRGRGLDDVDLDGSNRNEREVKVEPRDPGEEIPREQILRVLSRAQSQMRHCYERELGTTPDLHGKVVLEFTFGAGGKVTSANARHGTLAHSGVESCLERVVSRLSFPTPKREITVKYPLVFTTRGE